MPESSEQPSGRKGYRKDAVEAESSPEIKNCWSESRRAAKWGSLADREGSDPENAGRPG